MTKAHFLIALVLILVRKDFCSIPPSIDSLFTNPQVFQASLSWDGKYFVALYSEKDQISLMSYNLQTKKASRTSVPDHCDVWDYHWKNNESIIYEMIRDKKWVETVGIVNRDMKNPVTFVEGELVSIVNALPSDKDNALVWFRSQAEDNYGNEELKKVNVKTGTWGKSEKRFPGRVLGWYTDRFDNVRLAQAYRKGHDGKADWYYRPAIDSSWKMLTNNFPENFKLYGFSLDGRQLYLATVTDKNTASLCLFDPQKGAITKEIYNDPNYDFDGRLHFFTNPNFSKKAFLRGISYEDTSVWFDSAMAGIQKEIDSKVVGTKNQIISADTGLTKFLVASYADFQPDLFLLYDASTGAINLIAQSMPWLRTDALCMMREVSFQMRDSLRIHGYLTLPKSGRAPYPAVVLLHGGPNARDSWGFDPEVQLFATRGYAVLQVNYRGSAGFGKKISHDNRFDYLKMHEDVTDATVDAIRAGIFDSNRVAIMGASFGGYLAIAGAAFDPDLYSCAITNAGVFDWEKQWGHFKYWKNKKYFDELKEFLASKPDFKAYLKAASPIHSVDKIKIPVFIAGGESDNLVPIEQSYNLERLLIKSGNKPETYYKFCETHGFNYELNNIKYYEKVLAFLTDNIDKTKRKIK